MTNTETFRASVAASPELQARWHTISEVLIDETPVLPLRLASADDLAKSEKVIDLERLPRISDPPISRSKPVLWAEGKARSDDHSVWVPYELVHMDYTLPLQP